jgi:hypothetical protein
MSVVFMAGSVIVAMAQGPPTVVIGLPSDRFPEPKVPRASDASGVT